MFVSEMQRLDFDRSKATPAPNIILSAKEIVNNERYIIHDLEFPRDGKVAWTASETMLKPDQSTRGHSHEGQDELYFFTSGTGYMQVGGERNDTREATIYAIKPGAWVHVPMGLFHRVFNPSRDSGMIFYAVFQNAAQRPPVIQA